MFVSRKVRTMARDLYDDHFKAVESMPRGVVVTLRNIATQLESSWELHTNRQVSVYWVKYIFSVWGDWYIFIFCQHVYYGFDLLYWGLVRCLYVEIKAIKFISKYFRLHLVFVSPSLKPCSVYLAVYWRREYMERFNENSPGEPYCVTEGWKYHISLWNVQQWSGPGLAYCAKQCMWQSYLAIIMVNFL